MNTYLRKNRTKPRMLRLMTVALAMVMAFSQALATTSYALVTNPSATAKISFTFDDGLASVITQAMPTLAMYGLTGTSYVTTNCIGMTTVPNACRADVDRRYMTWNQVRQLQAAGWEIGSHTATHPYLATSDAGDGQPNVLTPAQVDSELAASKNALAAQGINAKAFSSPYGDYNPAVLAQIAKYYTSHRGFADQGNNIWPHSDYTLQNMPVQVGVTVAQVKAKIDQAIANKQWLILTMHEIAVRPSSDPQDYQYSTANLAAIAAYVQSKRQAGLIKPVNVSQGLVTSDSSLIAGGFDSGIAGGWTTDAPSAIVANAGNNGSFPGPINSVRLTSSSNVGHLFSPTVTVDPGTTYLLKNYLNVAATAGGQIGFYVDEYDLAGNWISGQWKGAEGSVFVESFNFAYKPTTSLVKKARLQVVVTANPGTTAYLDNVQMFALSTSAVPAQPNMLSGGTFDAGITGGWTTDSATTVVKDAASNGSPSNPVNSIKMQPGASAGAHLFSPKVTVDPAKNYLLQNYVKLTAANPGEGIWFYVDEYDAAGNWISGQWKGGRNVVGSGDFGIQYKPTSTNVKSAALQVIVSQGSGVTAYYDDARWYNAS